MKNADGFRAPLRPVVILGHTGPGHARAVGSAQERGHATPTPAVLTRLAPTVDCAREDLCSTQDAATDPHEFIRAGCAALPRLEDHSLTRIAVALRSIDLERT
ncbi:hypothetical protein [Allokutzneria albata]|uniref:Uncharacterized protein n=1 Tax=Allokutzneria albata TaxID=211114 RepID=A0A1G9QYX0_ALLAB|nr:hypothetical protein [Allokutzneria albata]SDM16218.1 hypothetical protein SAMN04489726_0099 [Allokutzneria albata]